MGKYKKLIPMIMPLHISLNNRETLFQPYHFFFEMLYHNLFGDKKYYFKSQNKL
jgi:hypothetical protein